MSFWLKESLVSVYLRGIPLRIQFLLTGGFIFLSIGSCVIYKNCFTFKKVKQLGISIVLDSAQNNSESIMTSKNVAKDSLSLNSLPRTLYFFSQAGFSVQKVERLFYRRSKKILGYSIYASGSFQNLMNFLEKIVMRQAAVKLHIKSIERLDNSNVSVEFFMRG